MNKESIKKWIEANLVMRDEAETITEQSPSAFGQSLASGKIVPFVEFGVKRKTRLYLREDLEQYAKNKKRRKQDMKTWVREGYQVVEVPFNYDLHEFEIWKEDEKVGTITPADLEDQERIIGELDAGEDVNGWEDGMGNTITV